MSYHIFAGRFQPFHIGHMKIVEQAVQHLGSEDILLIAVITSVNGIIIDDNFAKSAMEHHLPERNPWFPIVPLKAITSLCNTNYSKQILTTILPCTDTFWTETKKWFSMKASS
ncbi:MAG: adenylyltransferase/cytidyltransferase family protein [Candidatus Bathyarchaeota archaeon]|uniref:adenylyltransferase/cytidyltransferase family protein n=1 Tax=Candidatus Bathycorpusculum sp. TaxID=2994959 RepID=UPI002816C552|nr:adenylyltransferase/cytidyltransferase family protein [Candidatus Termiticorpusculum sp.]MCL2291676.1 adenylyltransferase/cytidyltransferase family protein [Candidatus Termiticorpusculum sp.]